jgi:pheromone shutdown protein TraB
MAARMAWITSETLKTGKNPKILALGGAAYMKGIKSLLRNPKAIRENLQRLTIPFTPPTLVRRIKIKGD